MGTAVLYELSTPTDSRLFERLPSPPVSSAACFSDPQTLAVKRFGVER